MKTYKIEVEEILHDICEINANSLEEAINIAKEKYLNEEIVLDYSNFKETNYREYKENIYKRANVDTER